MAFLWSWQPEPESHLRRVAGLTRIALQLQGELSSGSAGCAFGNHHQTERSQPDSHLFAPASAKDITKESEREGLAVLNKLNREHQKHWPGDSRLDARIASYELAAKMQMSAPDVLDIKGESELTRKLYGLDEKETADFGRSCLTARRLLERDVRFVQVWSGTAGATGNWDNHGDITKELLIYRGQRG